MQFCSTMKICKFQVLGHVCQKKTVFYYLRDPNYSVSNFGNASMYIMWLSGKWRKLYEVHFLKFDGSKYVHSVAFRKTPLIFYFQHWAICNMRGFYNFLTPPLIQRRQEIARCSFHTHEITDFTACWIFVCQFKKGCLWNWTTLWTEKKF